MKHIKVRLRKKVTCPNCWRDLDPADLLWVSSHPDLRGDAFLGEDELKRFLPSRFDAEGFALDAKGQRCHLLACPHCHLTVPRILSEVKPLVMSVIGAPSTGKSYFLASTIWQIRQKLSHFNVRFTDADPVVNKIVSGYEKRLFLADRPNEIIEIAKTQEDGDLYAPVNYGDRLERYARPFVYSLQPTRSHVQVQAGHTSDKLARALCLYDNAGEHFLPDQDSSLGPATDHLARSEALVFVFDPTNHPRFRVACREFSSDPLLENPRIHRQDEVLLEAAKRIRQKANLSSQAKIERPLIVAINKYDVWSKLLPNVDLTRMFPYEKHKGAVCLNIKLIEAIAERVRQMLYKHAPEFVSACDSICEDIAFIPMSPQGCSPEPGMEGKLGVRPESLNPIWAEVPLLYAIAKSRSGLIPTVRVSPSRGQQDTDKPGGPQDDRDDRGMPKIFKGTG